MKNTAITFLFVFTLLSSCTRIGPATESPNIVTHEFFLIDSLKELINIRYYWYNHYEDSTHFNCEFNAQHGETISLGVDQAPAIPRVANSTSAALTVGDTTIYYGCDYGICSFFNSEIYVIQKDTVGKTDEGGYVIYVTHTLTLDDQFLIDYPGNADTYEGITPYFP